MRKVIVGAMVSMDGVMQAPGTPTENPTNGFKFGGWQMSYFEQNHGSRVPVLHRGAREPRKWLLWPIALAPKLQLGAPKLAHRDLVL